MGQVSVDSIDSTVTAQSGELWRDGPEEEGRKHFSSLVNLECIRMNMEMRPYAETNTMFNDAMPSGGRKRIVGVKLPPRSRPGFASELLEEVGHKLSAVPELGNTRLGIAYFNPSKVCEVPISETAFPSRTKTLNGALFLRWIDPSNDQDFIAWGEAIQNVCETELRQAGHEPDKLVSTFFGYTHNDNTTPEDMFGVNANALLKVKRKYDLDNISNKLNPLKLSS